MFNLDRVRKMLPYSGSQQVETSGEDLLGAVGRPDLRVDHRRPLPGDLNLICWGRGVQYRSGPRGASS